MKRLSLVENDFILVFVEKDFIAVTPRGGRCLC
jgi:hypothetical protein